MWSQEAWDKVLLLSPPARQKSRRVYGVSRPQLSHLRNGDSLGPDLTEPWGEPGASSPNERRPQQAERGRTAGVEAGLGPGAAGICPHWQVGLHTRVRNRVQSQVPNSRSDS